MKNTIQLILLLCLATISTGCASTGGYFVDRGRDTADIFTATVGVGAGAKARVGPFSAGWFKNNDRIGLRGGQLFAVDHQVESVSDWISLWPKETEFFYAFGDERFVPQHPDHSDILTRSKAFKSYGPIIPFVTVVDNMIHSSETRKPNSPLLFYSQVELAVGLGGTFRLGFNLAELLDFILGWVTIDIFNDDIERKSNKPLQNTSQ